MDTTTIKAPDYIDDFDHDCRSDVEYGGTRLEGKPNETVRRLGVLSVCVDHRDDAFAEVYTFDCINPLAKDNKN